MSEFSEKTEQPSPHKLEEAQKRGQIPRSAEVQTTFVLLGGLVGLLLFGGDTWRLLTNALTATLGHLHDTNVSVASLQAQALEGALLALRCAGPVTAGALIGGLLAGGLQSRFQTASEALQPNWERLNPAQGFQRVFSTRSAIPTVLAAVKLAVIILLTYSTVQQVLSDPVFSSTVSLERLAAFLATASVKIFTRVLLALAVIAAADYAYQLWRTHQDLMMTRQELKEETKNQEGNPQIKANRRRLFRRPRRLLLEEVPTADLVLTNPTHIAVALRYDRRTMKAPRIVAKGVRLNAERIREIARQHHVPIRENPPLARLLYKHGRVGGEIPAELYLAVAEMLAWVYQANPYRYYTAAHRVVPATPTVNPG
ncbi:MAG: EscU/YscU/HrcU family type III secretion system export apparatus switch protein [Verrucomicrobiales bacterium]|nr:EscU/YscU/HrcU family type III secretion system export apparatus switch protein [Verrucomicrobiales bacterium]